MPKSGRITEADSKALEKLINSIDKLEQEIKGLLARTDYEDLEHAVTGLEIVKHALREVRENKGMGGHIEAVADREAHLACKALLDGVAGSRREASALLRTHPNEDLETAVRALEIARGSLEEVLERYD